MFLDSGGKRSIVDFIVAAGAAGVNRRTTPNSLEWPLLPRTS
jgi:hypothetical protein